jgi:hypothetical protein
MYITITWDDIREAEKRCAGKDHLHNWNNPIAIALERIYCLGGTAPESYGCAVVTMGMAHITGRGMSGSYPLSEDAKRYMSEWRHGRSRNADSLQLTI